MTDFVAAMIAPTKKNPDIRDLFLARQQRRKEMKQNVLFALVSVLILALAVFITI